MNDLVLFLRSKVFWKNLRNALGVLLLFLFFTSACMRIYTYHGRSIAVNDFRGMQIREALPLLEKRKFRHEISDSLFVADKEPGVILDQHPKPGFAVKKHRTIYFTINASAPDKIQIPNLKGVTFREGQARLNSFGLLVGKITYRYDISKNVILEQQIRGITVSPGDSVAKGTAIDLVLGKGLGDERAMVPNLKGMTLEQAKEKLTDAMFSLGFAVNDESVSKDAGAIAPRIFKQKPSSDPNVLIPLGSTITVWLTADSLILNGGAGHEDDDYYWDELNNSDEDTTAYDLPAIN